MAMKKAKKKSSSAGDTVLNPLTYLSLGTSVPGGARMKKRMNADSARKTKQAQSMGMDKVKAKKSANATSKRMTAEAKSYPPKKKAPSSYALGLKAKPKKKGM